MSSLASSSFSMEQLICAMAPTENVLHAFRQECCQEEENDERETVWYTEESQQLFAQIIQSHWSDIDTTNTNLHETSESGHEYCSSSSSSSSSSNSSHSGPSSRYLGRLVKRYVTYVETAHHGEIQNDDLMELIMKCSMMKDLNLPDARECCHVSYEVPFLHNQNKERTSTLEEKDLGVRVAVTSKIRRQQQQQQQQQQLRIQVYPHHNDVGVRKVWEAGACLAEFLLRNPHYVTHKSIVELGAGVGLTGLVVAGCCHATHVHMTDYTTPCLENLQHNIDINREWLVLQQKQHDHDKLSQVSTTTVTTCGYLEWDSYANDHDNGADTMIVKEPPQTESTSHSISSQATSVRKLSEADVLLAGDVAYDVSVLPSLGKLVRKFLYAEASPTGGGNEQQSSTTTQKQKLAIFATTLRNKKTFAALETALLENGIHCTYVDSKDLNLLPEIFPCYLLVQPRSDIRICLMTAAAGVTTTATTTIP